MYKQTETPNQKNAQPKQNKQPNANRVGGKNKPNGGKTNMEPNKQDKNK